MNIKERPKLSFCIPTYNRADMVVECVKRILQYTGDDIEVVVSDNCSEDDTLEKLGQIKDKRLNVSTNKKNLGYTQNLLKVISLASGNYCFMISDEDRVIDGAVPSILKLINNNYGLILSSVKKGNIYGQKQNVGALKQKIKNQIRPFYHYLKYGKNLSSYFIYHKENINDKIEVIKKIYSYTYLTGLIIKKDLIPLERITASDFIDMNVYPQVLIMLLVNEKSDTYFSNEAFTVMNEIPLKSHIMDEKKFNSHSYPHPLARMRQMISSFRWLEELNLEEAEERKLIFYMFGEFLNRARHGFLNYTSENDKKFSNKEFHEKSNLIYKTIEKNLFESTTNKEYEEYIIQEVIKFMEEAINVENSNM